MRKRTIAVLGGLAVSLYLIVGRSSSKPPEPTTHVFMLEDLAGDPRGKLDDLSVALEIARRNDVRWGELQRERPGLPLAELPEAERAIAALGRWARDRHAPAPPTAYRMRLYGLGKLALSTATASQPSGVETAQVVGHRLLLEGIHAMDGRLGAALLKHARLRERELGLPATTWWVPPPNALVRVLAAEALFMYRYAELPIAERDRILGFWAEVLKLGRHATDDQVVARFMELAPELGDMSTDFVTDLARDLAILRAP